MSKLKALIKEAVSQKHVAVLGCGREGLSTIAMLKKVGGYLSLTVLDKSPIEIEGASCVCGEHYMDDLSQYDLIFKSPGIPILDPPEQLRARLTSQTQLFLSAYRDQIIGVTGTKGKSTTSSLLYHVLIKTGRKAFLVGNIGVPAFECDDELTDDAVIVMELSAHQLQYVTVSPKTAVFLNLFPEHLDYYRTQARYRRAKENIYRFGQAGDFLVVGRDLAPTDARANVSTAAISPPADIYVTDEGGLHIQKTDILPDAFSTQLAGRHNRYNIAVVMAVLMHIGLDRQEILDAVASFAPLAHRLKPVGTFGGVLYIDDSISTVPQTVIEALHALKNVDTLLLGGMDRGVDLTPLLACLAKCDVPHILLMYDTGQRLLEEAKTNYPALYESGRLIPAGTLDKAVELAVSVTERGKICLLSPAAASYGVFKNFEERGDKFAELVQKQFDR